MPISLAMIFWGLVIVLCGVSLFLVYVFKICLFAAGKDIDLSDPVDCIMFIVCFPGVATVVVLFSVVFHLIYWCHQQIRFDTTNPKSYT